MIQENEVVTVVLSVGVLIFVFQNRSRLATLPSHRLAIGAFAALFAGQVLTVLEGFWYEDLLNLAEHICYSLSSLLVAAWCWRALSKGVAQP